MLDSAPNVARILSKFVHLNNDVTSGGNLPPKVCKICQLQRRELKRETLFPEQNTGSIKCCTAVSEKNCCTLLAVVQYTVLPLLYSVVWSTIYYTTTGVLCAVLAYHFCALFCTLLPLLYSMLYCSLILCTVLSYQYCTYCTKTAVSISHFCNCVQRTSNKLLAPRLCPGSGEDVFF